MKKYFKIFFINLLIMFAINSVFSEFVMASEHTVLNGYVEMIPQSFWGTWRVVSKRIDSDSPSSFREKSLDLWNLSKINNVITLCNPFNGAKAEIKLDRVDTNYVVFTKIGKYDNKLLTETVEIMLDGEMFTGFDSIKLETFSNGKIIKTLTAKYSLKGEKIAGNAIAN